MDNLDNLKRAFGAIALNNAISENADIIRLVESLFFRDKNCKDYRDSTINFCKNKLGWFNSSSNTVYESMGKFVKIKCPYCPRNMRHCNGGGGSGGHTSEYRCKCGAKFTISLKNNGIWFSKK